MALLITKTLPQFDGSVGNQIFYFGSRQTLTADLTTNGGDVFTNHTVLFNTAATLSNFAVQPPLVQSSKVWSLDLTGLTVGGAYAMGWLGSENTRNGTATLTYTSATAATISYTFYVTADTDDYPSDANPYDSLLRLTYGSVKDPAAFTLSYPSWCLGAASNRGFRIHASIYTSSTLAYVYDVFNNTKTLFFNKRAGVNTPPVLQAQSFSLFAPDGITPRTLVSTNDDTLIKIVLQGNASVPSGAFVAVYKINLTDTVSNFDTLIKGWTFIPGVPDPGSSTYDGIIKAPIGGAFVFGGEQDYHFTFDKTLVEAGAQYRVVVGSKNTDDLNRGVFMSAVFVGGATPPPAIYPDYISDTIKDYWANYGGSVISCVQSRLRSTVTFDRASYETKIAAAGLTGTYNGFLKQLYFQVVDTGTNSVLYQTAPGDPLISRVDAGPNTTYSIERRLVHDEVAIKTWAGKNLQFRWVQVFEYTDPSTGLHTDTITFPQDVVCRNYDNFAVSPKIVSLQLTDGTGDIGTHCGLVSATVKVTASDAAPGNQIAFIDHKFFSTAHLEEEDPTPSAQGFTQLNTLKLAAATNTFTASIATFDIIPPMLTNGTQYRVSSIRRII